MLGSRRATFSQKSRGNEHAYDSLTRENKKKLTMEDNMDTLLDRTDHWNRVTIEITSGILMHELIVFIHIFL